LSASPPLFRFVQVEVPWPLGPPDGRYLVRAPGAQDAAPSHVIVFTTLGAAERRRLVAPSRLAGRNRRPADPEPEPTPVATGRATIIEVGAPLAGEAPARAWLDAAGEDELAAGLLVLNRALHAFRLVTADPYLHPVGRRQALVARVGFGAGEEVADGLWTGARELPTADGARRRRTRALAPQARLAAVLGARQPPLAGEELTLRARLDVDHGRPREAALQLLVALDATIAELAADPHAAELRDRLTELRGLRDAVAAAAQAALAGPLGDADAETVSATLARVEAALRARAATAGN
jgi:hypothetical protein